MAVLNWFVQFWILIISECNLSSGCNYFNWQLCRHDKTACDFLLHSTGCWPGTPVKSQPVAGTVLLWLQSSLSFAEAPATRKLPFCTWRSQIPLTTYHCQRSTGSILVRRPVWIRHETTLDWAFHARDGNQLKIQGTHCCQTSTPVGRKSMNEWAPWITIVSLLVC